MGRKSLFSHIRMNYIPIGWSQFPHGPRRGWNLFSLYCLIIYFRVLLMYPGHITHTTSFVVYMIIINTWNNVQLYAKVNVVKWRSNNDYLKSRSICILKSLCRHGGVNYDNLKVGQTEHYVLRCKHATFTQIEIHILSYIFCNTWKKEYTKCIISIEEVEAKCETP